MKYTELSIEKLKSDKTTLVDAAKKNFLPNVNTKSLFNKNEKKIEELSVRLEKIKKENLFRLNLFGSYGEKFWWLQFQQLLLVYY